MNKIGSPYHCDCFGKNVRSLVIGKSGSGKSRLVIQKYLLQKCSIHNIYYLDYNTLIIVSPNIDQFYING